MLRLQPHAIPAFRTALVEALDQLDTALGELRRSGALSQPWMGDEVSGETAAYYTHRAIDSTDSSFQALSQYRAELNRVHDTLGLIEDNYRRTEGDNAALWGLRA